ncbi:hypothetical protein TNCV_301631 [Trichonephila clavipes]|nr:hypothetical protein TNCV_301631 [Trichonephila clavipes]
MAPKEEMTSQTLYKRVYGTGFLLGNRVECFMFVRKKRDNHFSTKNVRPEVDHHILIYHDTENVHLLPWLARYPELLPLKTSIHGQYRNWDVTALLPLQLMKCGTDLKLHGMTCLYLSSKPNQVGVVFVSRAGSRMY